MSTSAKRREQARAAAAALKEKQARQAARQRATAIAGLLVGLVVVGVLVAVILANGRTIDAAASGFRPVAATGHGGIVFDAAGPVTPPSDATFTPGARGFAEDWPQGAGLDGGAVVVSVYVDMMCPNCAQFEAVNASLLDELRADGTIVVDSHPVAILDYASAGTRYPTRAAAAAWAVADLDPAHYFDFIEALMANQPAEGSTGLTDRQIADLATRAGVDGTAVQAFTGEDYLAWAATATDIGSQDLSRLTTPTILINGRNLRDLGVSWSQPGALRAAIEAAKG